jgi:hypothetical protein
VRILFDQGTPVPLRLSLAEHEVVTAFELGWSVLTNGELLDAAERDGFEILVTTDSNLKYQQDLQTRQIAIVVLSTTNWPRIQRVVNDVARQIAEAARGTYREIAIH